MRRLRRLGVGLAALLLLAAAAAAWTALQPAASTGAPVIFEVPKGAGVARIARDLQRRGVIRQALAFRVLARLRGLDAGLRAGEYELAPSLSPGDILAQIAQGRVRTHRIVLPEGLTAVEIAGRLQDAGLADAKAFLTVVRDPGIPAQLGVEGKSLEGYLFPETYQLARGLPPKEIARAMVAEFLKAWAQVAPTAKAIGFDMKDTVTLASIVEKETGVPKERPLIAAVFHNRLRRGMLLQTDPAVIYGIPDFDGNLRRIHLEDPANPYNTYRHPGLPPGPISNPGLDALRAVVAPADVDYLYFVSRGDGTHHFSRSYSEHRAAVAHYQLRRRR